MISNNIWKKLTKPILIQAPMENVTDTVFRQVLARYGRPDLFFTEFTNVEGLFSPGYKNVAERLKFTQIEKPIIAQVWGTRPEKFFEAGKLLKNMEFDGIDINMGCPDRTVVRKGSGAALIQNQNLAKEIIQAAREGSLGLAVSVKTRIGFNKIITADWIGFLLTCNLDAITIHARTAKQASNGNADWEEVGKAVQMRDNINSKTLIIGNGDIKSRKEAIDKYEKYGVDGVMIARGMLGNMWIFNGTVDPSTIPITERLKLLLEHIILFENTWGNTKSAVLLEGDEATTSTPSRWTSGNGKNLQKNFLSLKKFYKFYINGFNGASQMRTKLVGIDTLEGTKREIEEYINKVSNY